MRSSRKMSKQKGRGLEEISWKCLVLGARPPQEFDGGRWISPARSEYPIDIVLGLEKICNIYKVVIQVNEEFIPSKIELALGLADNKLETNYKNARKAEFSDPVHMEFSAEQRIAGRMEAKNAFMDSAGQYLWILVYGPHDGTDNPHRKVGIDSITILGYALKDDEIADLIPKGNKSIEKPSTPSRANTGSAHAKRQPVTRYSYNGDGMQTGNGMLAGDPLTTVRLVKKILGDKMEKAKENDRDVEMSVCLRATQRLTEYEAMLVDLSHRWSNALIHNDVEQADRIRVAMADCRDTVLRAIHVDLLLGRNELRAIGVNSNWAPHE